MQIRDREEALPVLESYSAGNIGAENVIQRRVLIQGPTSEPRNFSQLVAVPSRNRSSSGKLMTETEFAGCSFSDLRRTNQTPGGTGSGINDHFYRLSPS